LAEATVEDLAGSAVAALEAVALAVIIKKRDQTKAHLRRQIYESILNPLQAQYL
jgi:hypothetical protein